MQRKLEPKQDHSKVEHGRVTIRPFVVTGRHSPKLLQTVDQPLDLIALSVEFPIKRTGRMLVFHAWDGRSDAAEMQVPTIFVKSLPFIPRHPLGMDVRAIMASSNSILFHQLLGNLDHMLLSTR